MKTAIHRISTTVNSLIGSNIDLSDKEITAPRFTMPDKSIQHLILFADRAGKAEFHRIVDENKWNKEPIFLQQKSKREKSYVIPGEHLLTESDAYKFLVEKLRVTNPEGLNKKDDTLLFIKSKNERIYMIEIFFPERIQIWNLSFTCISSNVNQRLKLTRNYELFYR